MNIAILGAGTWGVALAKMLKETGNNVKVWSALEQEIEYVNNNRKHPNLKNIDIDIGIAFTTDMEFACQNSDIILLAVPSIYMRKTVSLAKKHITNQHIIVEVAKGLELHSLMTMTELIEDELNPLNPAIVALSGPSHAEEVALCMPTTIVAASKDKNTAIIVQDVFSSSYMRVYTNDDIKGIELSGAFKNIIAIATGIAEGLGYGDNTKAALITRGMAEITRLGTKMGCRSNTFASLAGIGDLVVTCTSQHSRNNRAGKLIGQGYSPKEAVEKVGMVVEGLNALPAAIELSKKYDVDMPICNIVNAIAKGEIKAKDALDIVMSRTQKPELVDKEEWF